MSFKRSKCFLLGRPEYLASYSSDVGRNARTSSKKQSLIFSDFNRNWYLLTNVSKNSNKNHENTSNSSPVVTHEQTGKHSEINRLITATFRCVRA